MHGRILIVDDDRELCKLLEDDLGQQGFSVRWANGAEEALSLLQAEEFDLVLTDMRMPGTDGIGLCSRILENRPDAIVLVMTAFGSMDSAVAALRAGAYDFVTKPMDLDALPHTLARAVQHRELQERVKVLRRAVEESNRFEELIGASAAMKSLYDLLGRVAGLESTLLITGESGTGKELAARALHQGSSRREGPFVAVNCAAMPETLLESELFGHVGGAFTDARGARKGLFVEAHTGTFFLDEIVELPTGLQPKLLRALEERTVRPLGSDREVPIDVRVIAATNRDLEAAVEDGTFREDLFYRINVIQVSMPPLRTRGNDVLLLAQHFVEHFAAANAKHVVGITESAAEKLLSYPWPGNVRELRNCMERAVALTRCDQIVPGDLPEKIRTHTGRRILLGGDDPSELLPMEEIERRYILHVLESMGGNRTAAARTLGFDRKTLYRKLRQYGISGGPSPYES
jgi:two-component system, NtrC family, response regulator AtoC